MTTIRPARLDNFGSALEDGGYVVQVGELAGETALLAETPYALVACVQAETYDGLAERVSDVQAALTQLAAQAPSPRQWDLYLLVHVLVPPTDPVDEALAEAIEADTRYVRKFVRSAIDLDQNGAVDKALRPLLPLRLAPEFDVSDPLDALRQELHDLELPDELVSTAVDAFRRGEEVIIP